MICKCPFLHGWLKYLVCPPIPPLSHLAIIMKKDHGNTACRNSTFLPPPTILFYTFLSALSHLPSTLPVHLLLIYPYPIPANQCPSTPSLSCLPFTPCPSPICNFTAYILPWTCWYTPAYLPMTKPASYFYVLFIATSLLDHIFLPPSFIFTFLR